MAVRDLPDVAFLRECFNYNPETGEFHWRVRPLAHFVDEWHQKSMNTQFAGRLAGTVSKRGYRTMMFQRKGYKAHRIAWLLIYGEPVPPEIDHIDDDPGNNRIGNLRAASHADNAANSRLQMNNSLGVKGIRQRESGRFSARIRRQYKWYWLGTFDTLEEAVAVRKEATERLHGEFARP